MGIFMDSIDFNECLKKKKELEKEAGSTAPEEVKEEKVEEKKERNKQSLFIDGRGNRGKACRQGRNAASGPTMNNSSCPSDIMVAKIYGESKTPSTLCTPTSSSFVSD